MIIIKSFFTIRIEEFWTKTAFSFLGQNSILQNFRIIRNSLCICQSNIQISYKYLVLH